MNTKDLEEIAKILQIHEERIKSLEMIIKNSKSEIKKQLSARDLFNLVKPKNHSEKILVSGYYLEKSKGLKNFTTKDIAKCFREAKEKTPSNINDQINKLILKGHMMTDEKTKENLTSWILTNTGEAYIESKFKK